MIDNLIMNEKTYVENLIKNKDSGNIKSIKFIIKLLIRYYRQYSNLYDSNMRDEILEIIKQLDFVKLQEYQLSKLIYDLIDKEKENNIKLKEFDYIPLYQSELDKINSCSKDREKKFLFTCYILSEFYRNEWINISYTDLFKLSNISMSQKDQCLFIGDMKDKGFIDISYSNTNLSLKVITDKQGEEVFNIDNISNLGNKLMAYLKPNYIICQGIYEKDGTKKDSVCGKLIKIKSKTCKPKYCKECAEIMNRMNTLENYYDRKI